MADLQVEVVGESVEPRRLYTEGLERGGRVFENVVRRHVTFFVY